ncbi:unnamed protein product, partial [Diabrotica balteata]
DNSNRKPSIQKQKRFTILFHI